MARTTHRAAALEVLASVGRRLDDHAAISNPHLPYVDEVREVPLDELRFEHQPRELVPDADLDRLIAAGEARPATVLATLRAVAADDPYYAEILAELGELARSIESQGVLQPIQVALADGAQMVVRDGHRCRSGSVWPSRNVAHRPSRP